MLGPCRSRANDPLTKARADGLRLTSKPSQSGAADVVAVLEVMRQLVDLDRAEARFTTQSIMGRLRPYLRGNAHCWGLESPSTVRPEE
jgi:hypothetical protein